MMENNDSNSGSSNADVTFSSEEWSDLADLMTRGEGKSFIQPLVDAGHDVNDVKYEGFSVLVYAAVYGDKGLVEYLIEKSVNPNVEYLQKSRLLELAAAYGHEEIVELLLISGVPINTCTSEGLTPIYYAARHGHATVVKFLIEKGAALDEKVTNGYTPLLIAANKKHVNIVLMLINAGANIDYYDCEQRTVLSYALVNGWLEVIQSLSKRGIDFNLEMSMGEIPVLEAANYYRIDIVMFLLEWGVNVNCFDKLFTTLLHVASDHRLAGVARIVVEKGGDVNATDKEGWTPLDVACFVSQYDLIRPRARIEITELLIKNGAHVNSRNCYGETPLGIAFICPRRKIEIIKLLLKAGADCNMENNLHQTLFDRLVLENDNEMINLCIENGTYFNEELNPLFKEVILRDVNFCSRALVNKFNNKDLPLLYELGNIADGLPSIENMNISETAESIQDIKDAVNQEIQAKGFCNVFKVRPMMLRMLTVEALLGYYNK